MSNAQHVARFLARIKSLSQLAILPPLTPPPKTNFDGTKLNIAEKSLSSWRKTSQLHHCVAVLMVMSLTILAFESTSIAAPQSAFFDANGVKVHYLLEGTGEPVVLIHGMDSSALMNWQAPGIIDALAKDHYRVVALDLPGYGESDKPSDPSAYGEAWVNDVILLLDHLKIAKAHIVGYSMGGMVALKLIAEHPDLVLSGTLGGMGYLREGGLLQKVWLHMRNANQRGASELALTEDQVRSIKTPVEMIVGDRDPIRKMYVDPLARLRPDWRVVEIQDAGHITCIVKPQFIAELEKWLNANRQQSTALPVTVPSSSKILQTDRDIIGESSWPILESCPATAAESAAC